MHTNVRFQVTCIASFCYYFIITKSTNDSIIALTMSLLITLKSKYFHTGEVVLGFDTSCKSLGVNTSCNLLGCTDRDVMSDGDESIVLIAAVIRLLPPGMVARLEATQ